MGVSREPDPPLRQARLVHSAAGHPAVTTAFRPAPLGCVAGHARRPVQAAAAVVGRRTHAATTPIKIPTPSPNDMMPARFGLTGLCCMLGLSRTSSPWPAPQELVAPRTMFSIRLPA